MSGQDLAAQVEELRARQDQTDQSLVALAGAIEDLIKEAEGSAVSGTALRGVFESARKATAAVTQAHQGNRGR